MFRFRWLWALSCALAITFSIAPKADADQLVPANIKRIFAPENKKLFINGVDDKRVDVDIAVIDNGIDLDHPDLNVVRGVDCSEADSKEDCEENTSGLSGSQGDPGAFAHGTGVAGTAAAIDNRFGIVGVAPGARLWAVNAAGDGFEKTPPVFDLDAYVSAVEWVTAHADEIEVVALSLVCPATTPSKGQTICVGDAGTQELREVIEESMDEGVVYVTGAYAVDENVDKFFPQNLEDMIVVSHIADFDGEAGSLKKSPLCEGNPAPAYSGKDDTLDPGSNWGTLVDFTVPGFCIPRTVPGGGFTPGQEWAASSSAFPHAVGAAALLASREGKKPTNRKQVEELETELTNAGNLNWTDSAGEGSGDPGDGEQERLLDLRDETVFIPKMDPGPAWIVESTPNAGAGIYNDNRLTDISCTSSTFCLATANLVASGTTYAYGVTWNGSSWQSTAGAPDKDNAGVELSGVACTSSTSCIAVGSEKEANGNVLNIAVLWDGTKWSRQEVPNAGAGIYNDNRLTDISCTSSTFCLATANLVASGTTYAYGVTWNGSSWQSTGGAPYKDNAGVELSGVACTSSTSCIAVGSEKELSGDLLTLAVRWDGTKWSRQETPSEAGATLRNNRLTGVSCTSVCRAVGSFINAAGVWNLALRTP